MELVELGLQTTADPSGALTFANVSLTLGVNALTASATDAAGNQRMFSRTMTRVQPNTAPTLQTVGSLLTVPQITGGYAASGGAYRAIDLIATDPGAPAREEVTFSARCPKLSWITRVVSGWHACVVKP